MKSNEWCVSRYSIKTNRYGYINLLRDGNKWRAAFGYIDEVQEAFDGGTSTYRLFDTVEEAQKAVDTFKFDGVIWRAEVAGVYEDAYEGLIDGYRVVVSMTESWRSHGEDHEIWEVTECDCQDFFDWLHDREDVFTKEEREGYKTPWSEARSAKAEVVELWAKYQVFCKEHQSYDAYCEALEVA